MSTNDKVDRWWEDPAFQAAGHGIQTEAAVPAITDTAHATGEALSAAIVKAPEAKAESVKCVLTVPLDYNRYADKIVSGLQVCEVEAAVKGGIFALTVTDKGQDTVVVEEGPDGVVSIANADGVSMCLNGRTASLTAGTASARASLSNRSVNSESFNAAARALDEYRAPLPNGRPASLHELAVDKRDNSMQGVPPAIAWMEKFAAQRYLEKGALAATTLNNILYFPKENRAELGYTADSPIYVIEPGKPLRKILGNEAQVYYLRSGTSPGRPTFEELTNLVHGTIVISASDGLEEVEELGARLRGYEDAESIMAIINDHIKEYGVSDDISVVGFVHLIA